MKKLDELTHQTGHSRSSLVRYLVRHLQIEPVKIEPVQVPERSSDKAMAPKGIRHPSGGRSAKEEKTDNDEN